MTNCCIVHFFEVEVGVGEYGTKGIRKIEEERMRLRRGDLLKSVKSLKVVCFLRESQQNEVEAVVV